MGLTGFVIIHVFIATFSPTPGERNKMVKFTRPVNSMPMSTRYLCSLVRGDGKRNLQSKSCIGGGDEIGREATSNGWAHILLFKLRLRLVLWFNLTPLYQNQIRKCESTRHECPMQYSPYLFE